MAEVEESGSGQGSSMPWAGRSSAPSAFSLLPGVWLALHPLTLEVLGGGMAWPSLASWGEDGQAGKLDQGLAAVHA